MTLDQGQGVASTFITHAAEFTHLADCIRVYRNFSS